FDKVLLDHAAESGAEVHEQTAVDRVEFSEDDVDLTVKSNGSSRAIRTRYVIDASGRASVLGRQFKIKKTYDHLQKLSIFAHYDGVWRAEGIDGTLTVLIRAIDRWFWLIPIAADRTSVGVVLDSETFRKSKLSAGEFLDHSHKAKRLFPRYERAVNRAMDIYLRFVNAWYTKEFIEVFLAPRNVLGLAPAVNAVLGGNVGNSFPIRWRMWVFYFLVWLQRHHPVAPRLTLVPKKDETPASPQTAGVMP